MSRKTASIAAIASLAIATTLFPSGRDAAALAQAATPVVALPAPAAELVPEGIEYFSEPVVQPLNAATPTATPEPAPTLTEAGTLAELVGMVDTDAPMKPWRR